ncbi:MAG: hypothetical protein II175_00330, partial [Schwartzia sp.]|nr:hypothetical protein [Schwartzia sp. (in: firmicutes)]
EKSEALKRRVSSGNVVPAVGKSEGATPRRMECIAIKKPKIYIEKNQTKFDETLKRYILPLAKSELWLIMP